MKTDSILYKTTIKELIKNQSELFQKVKNSDYSEVCYQQEQTGRYGICDKNYTSRLKLAYYILFEKADSEDIVKRLFEEELKDRQTNSFQGIGTCLEILTHLLMKYNSENKYQGLFQRAKNANFDCICGYTVDTEIENNLENYAIDECIDIAVKMKCFDYAEILVDCWKENVSEWNEQTFHSLIYYNKNIGKEIENEKPLKQILTSSLLNGNNFDIISSWKNLIHYYIQFGDYEKAYQNFINMKNQTKISEIYTKNLFKHILEDCMELICGYSNKADELWKWAKPFIKQYSAAGNMHGNLYKKSIEAAHIVQDSFEKELSKSYDIWKQKMHLI